jgi:hypothetical protein
VTATTLSTRPSSPFWRRSYDDRQLRQEAVGDVDVRIGVQNATRELEVLLADDTDSDKLRQHVDKALSSGGTLWLTDRRGRRFGVPVDKLAYVEIGSSEAGRRIGFGA